MKKSSQQQNSALLENEEACINDKLLLPSSTRTLKRRISLFEKSRDWARRFITLHRSRRNTISNEKLPDISYELNKKELIKTDSSNKFLSNYQKNFDEDGYLSPLEIKAQLDNSPQENSNHPISQNSSSNSNGSQIIYRYHDPNIQPTVPSQCVCQQEKRLPKTSFVSEFQKSLSIVDYIDFDAPDESTNDDPIECVKYLFNDNHGIFSRRIPRRSTNVSSISTDSGYSDIPLSSSKFVPVHLISCTLIPVNVMTCTCRSSSSSTTCLERKYSSYSSRQPLGIENGIHNNNSCACYNKYYSTMTIYPSIKTTKTNDLNTKQQKKHFKRKRTNFKNILTDDLTSVLRWYKPYLERDAVCDALQHADYGAFILRNSTTHSDCYALSIKVPKFTHDSNIVHYLIEKILVDNKPSYRIKGTNKQFPTLLSLLTHHSVMPEILPITLNLNESFTV